MNGFLKKAALFLSMSAVVAGGYLVAIQLTGNFAAGVPGDRVMLQKPQQMDGGDGREARRVEVSPAQ